MIKRLLAGILAAALLLLGGCGADARHEIYRVYEGRNGDWALEVRRWVEYNKSVLLPKDLVADDSGVWTRTYCRIEYQGEKTEAELGITRLVVKGDNWTHTSEITDEEYINFDSENSWVSTNSSTNGINVEDSEACYALLTDTDGTIRIDAPLAKSKGDKY